MPAQAESVFDWLRRQNEPGIAVQAERDRQARADANLARSKADGR